MDAIDSESLRTKIMEIVNDHLYQKYERVLEVLKEFFFSKDKKRSPTGVSNETSNKREFIADIVDCIESQCLVTCMVEETGHNYDSCHWVYFSTKKDIPITRTLDENGFRHFMANRKEGYEGLLQLSFERPYAVIRWYKYSTDEQKELLSPPNAHCASLQSCIVEVLWDYSIVLLPWNILMIESSGFGEAPFGEGTPNLYNCL